MVTYEVKISKRLVESFLERKLSGQYWWEVDVRIDGAYQSTPASNYGWAKSLDKARSKALKHIIKVDKKFNSSEKFGVIIKADGDLTDMIEVLGD